LEFGFERVWRRIVQPQFQLVEFKQLQLGWRGQLRRRRGVGQLVKFFHGVWGHHRS
jgi:hypothetical protein